MFTIVKVTQARHLVDYRLNIVFSDGSSGEHDFGKLVGGRGSMVEPLRDAQFFGQVFVAMGVPTWPNGFAVDAIKLHMDMEAAGELNRDAAE